MRTRCNVFQIIILFITFLVLTMCKNPLFYTDFVPQTTEPAYENTIDSNTFEIIALGDAGHGTGNQDMVASWMKTYNTDNPVSFALMGGDNFYENGVTSVDDPLFITNFEEIYDDNLSETIFYPVLGNHDYRGNVDAQILYTEKSTRWKMPALYYYFVYYLADNTKIDFFALDSNIIITRNPLADGQKDWFQKVLADSDADWKIVYTHHPLYSNGEHGNNLQMIYEIQYLLEKFDVDICIGGHDHDLQVIKPLNGVHYFVSGAAGKQRPTSIAENTEYAKGTFGFMTLKIRNNSIIVRVIIENTHIDYEMVIEK